MVVSRTVTTGVVQEQLTAGEAGASGVGLGAIAGCQDTEDKTTDTESLQAPLRGVVESECVGEAAYRSRWRGLTRTGTRTKLPATMRVTSRRINVCVCVCRKLHVSGRNEEIAIPKRLLGL